MLGEVVEGKRDPAAGISRVGDEGSHLALSGTLSMKRVVAPFVSGAASAVATASACHGRQIDRSSFVMSGYQISAIARPAEAAADSPKGAGAG